MLLFDCARFGRNCGKIYRRQLFLYGFNLKKGYTSILYAQNLSCGVVQQNDKTCWWRRLLRKSQVILDRLLANDLIAFQRDIGFRNAKCQFFANFFGQCRLILTI